jgi:hypothetical protein
MVRGGSMPLAQRVWQTHGGRAQPKGHRQEPFSCATTCTMGFQWGEPGRCHAGLCASIVRLPAAVAKPLPPGRLWVTVRRFDRQLRGGESGTADVSSGSSTADRGCRLSGCSTWRSAIRRRDGAADRRCPTQTGYSKVEIDSSEAVNGRCRRGWIDQPCQPLHKRQGANSNRTPASTC